MSCLPLVRNEVEEHSTDRLRLDSRRRSNLPSRMRGVLDHPVRTSCCGMLSFVGWSFPYHHVCEYKAEKSVDFVSLLDASHFEFFFEPRRSRDSSPRVPPFSSPITDSSCLLSIILVRTKQLSLHFLDDQEASRLGFSKEDQERLPAVWFAGTRGALWQSDFLTNHSLECLQIIILSGVYLANQDRA